MARGARLERVCGTNRLQLVLEHPHDGNFEIDFIYLQIQWTNGYAGAAQAGMTDRRCA